MFPFVWWWKTAVAGDKIIGDDGDKPFPGRIDNPASGDARRVAAEAHAHGKRLFPAGRAALEAPIQVKSHSGKVTEILQ